MLEYSKHLLNYGGFEYDNFVKLRYQVDENLDSVLSGKIKSDQLNIIKESMRMYQSCKENKLASVDLLLNIVEQIGGWPIISTGVTFDNYKWQKALVTIFTNIRSDVLITLESTINMNSVRQLKLSYYMFFTALTNCILYRKWH